MISEKTIDKIVEYVWVFVFMSIVYFIGFAVSTLQWESKHQTSIDEYKIATKEIEKLQKELDNKTNDLIEIAGRHISSFEYKRELIYKKSNIWISRKLSEDHLDLMMATADYYHIPYHIYFRLGAKESNNFSTTKTSPKGAMYYFQIMPSTFESYAKRLGIKKHTIENNIRLSGLIINNLYKLYNGDWIKAIAAYNAGEGAVDKYNGVPDYKETKSYVRFIMNFK